MGVFAVINVAVQLLNNLYFAGWFAGCPGLAYLPLMVWSLFASLVLVLMGYKCNRRSPPGQPATCTLPPLLMSPLAHLISGTAPAEPVSRVDLSSLTLSASLSLELCSLTLVS